MTCGKVSHWCDFDGSGSSDGFHEYDRLVEPISPESQSDDVEAFSMDPCKS